MIPPSTSVQGCQTYQHLRTLNVFVVVVVLTTRCDVFGAVVVGEQFEAAWFPG